MHIFSNIPPFTYGPYYTWKVKKKAYILQIVEAPQPDMKTVPELCQSSAWLNINLLLLSPDRALVEEKEVTLIRFLESYGKNWNNIL